MRGVARWCAARELARVGKTGHGPVKAGARTSGASCPKPNPHPMKERHTAAQLGQGGVIETGV
eukprot:scaffold56550_cov69-Phaeocystis_antarctica.AAC.1